MATNNQRQAARRAASGVVEFFKEARKARELREHLKMRGTELHFLLAEEMVKIVPVGDHDLELACVLQTNGDITFQLRPSGGQNARHVIATVTVRKNNNRYNAAIVFNDGLNIANPQHVPFFRYIKAMLIALRPIPVHAHGAQARLLHALQSR